jgi:GTP cyclohydrolase I
MSLDNYKLRRMANTPSKQLQEKLRTEISSLLLSHNKKNKVQVLLRASTFVNVDGPDVRRVARTLAKYWTIGPTFRVDTLCLCIGG